MEFNKVSLKNLIKIVRLNKKNKDVMEALDIKDIRYAKKKPLYEYMNAHVNDFTILEEDEEVNEEVNEEVVNNENNNNDNVDYESDLENRAIPEEPKIKQKVIEINLDNIKNKKKVKQVQETPEETEARTRAILMIEKFYARFPWLHEEQIDLSNPVKALQIVENKISARNTASFISQNFFALCGGIESFTVNNETINKYVKLQGFTKNIQANEAAQDVLDEIIIKYTPVIMGEGGLSVEARFGLIILGCLYQTHQVNLLCDTVKDVKNKPVNRKFDL